MIPKKQVIDNEIESSTLTLLKLTKRIPIIIKGRQYLPADVNTSPMDNSKSHKEGDSRTYKQFDGYHPICCFLGREGYMTSTA